jgi:hypothetical protein
MLANQQVVEQTGRWSSLSGVRRAFRSVLRSPNHAKRTAPPGICRFASWQPPEVTRPRCHGRLANKPRQSAERLLKPFTVKADSTHLHLCDIVIQYR